MRVFVYRNLNKKCWSARSLEGDSKGRVVARGMSLKLHGPIQCRVGKAGRERVRKEKVKNVHAGIVGFLNLKYGTMIYDNDVCVGDDCVEITYNPYIYTEFVNKDGTPINVTPSEALFTADGRCFLKGSMQTNKGGT
jgi:hypothetical protein